MPKLPSPKDSDSDYPTESKRVPGATKCGKGWFKSHHHPPPDHDLIETLKLIMSALENLTQAIVDLQTSVDAAVTVINTPHPTDAQVQTAADAVNAQSARLNAAVSPPAPTP